MDHRFDFGENVVADGDQGNKMVVIGVLYLPRGGASVKLSYWCNGDLKEVWVDEWRLARPA